MFGRRGQGAMEYLMTYGWAILVVMIVGIVMWQLGIFNMGGTTLTSTGFAKIKPQLAATGIRADGSFNGVFTNGVGTSITIWSVNVTDTASPNTYCVVDQTGIEPNVTSAGQNFKVTGTDCVTAGKPGDLYTAAVSIDYTVSIGNIATNHTESGSLRGPME